jgi:hypothetical protein
MTGNRNNMNQEPKIAGHCEVKRAVWNENPVSTMTCVLANCDCTSAINVHEIIDRAR